MYLYFGIKRITVVWGIVIFFFKFVDGYVGLIFKGKFVIVTTKETKTSENILHQPIAAITVHVAIRNKVTERAVSYFHFIV